MLLGCENLTPEEKSLENCEKHIREERKIDESIELIENGSEVTLIKDSHIETFPYENAFYSVFLEFDTEDEYKKFGDCLCDEEGNVIPRNHALEKEMEQKAESENSEND